ncbi:MAG: alpha/beta hydrolase [Acidimicrobiales bacterium]
MDHAAGTGSDPGTPLEHIGLIGHQDVAVTDRLDHYELFSWDGLLTLLWHHDRNQPNRNAVLCCGGALGGVLGPAGGLFHDLGTRFAADGTAITIRVGYRAPNDLDRCVFDVLAAAQLAARHGAERFVVVGHSFGGAVAVQAGAALGEQCAGVVTLATQTAGCEVGEQLAERGVPVLLLHGDLDTILPYHASHLVHLLTGGELHILRGADHRLDAAADELRERLGEWIPRRLVEHR